MSSVRGEECERLSPTELVYQSSEQYLILCLKICNMIMKSKCEIERLFDMSEPSSSSSLSSSLSTSSSFASSFSSSIIVNGAAVDTGHSGELKRSILSPPPFLTATTTITTTTNATTETSSLSSLPPPPPSSSFWFDSNLSQSIMVGGGQGATTSIVAAQLLAHLNATECVKYAHKESYKLSLFICGILLCFLILVLNSLTLITIVKTRRLHTITNMLIANLSASDFLSGVAFLYPCILNLLTINALETYDSYLYTLACNIRQYYYLCLAGYSPMITSMLSSMLTLTLLAFEKYMAIEYPYVYERIVVEHRFFCYLSIFVTWTISIVVSALPIMGWNEHIKYSSYRGFNCIHSQSMPCMFERIFTLDYILLFTGICCVCALTMLGIYGRIYLIARKHSRQIAKIHSILGQQQQHIDSMNLNPSTTQDSHRNHHDNQQHSLQQQQAADEEISVESCGGDKEKGLFELDQITNESETKQSNHTNSKNNNSKRQRSTTSTSMYHHHHDHHRNNNSVSVCSTGEHSSSTASRSLSMNMKAMKTLLILLLGFYLCWVPLIAYFLAFASKKYNNLTIYILMFVACCNAVIDPLVYAFRNREFYKAMLFNFRFIGFGACSSSNNTNNNQHTNSQRPKSPTSGVRGGLND